MEFKDLTKKDAQISMSLELDKLMMPGAVFGQSEPISFDDEGRRISSDQAFSSRWIHAHRRDSAVDKIWFGNCYTKKEWWDGGDPVDWINWPAEGSLANPARILALEALTADLSL